MTEQSGSIILKSIHSSAAKADVAAYLRQYAKNIPNDRIPELLNTLPVILARNVPATTGRLVAAEMRRLNADVSFIPREPAASALLQVETAKTRTPARPALHLPWLRGLGGGRRLMVVKELLIITSMLIIAWLLNYSLASQYLLLGFYTLPTVMAAFFFGKRHAVLTAFASILLVMIICYLNPERFHDSSHVGIGGVDQWYHVISWGCILLVTAYTMGILYQRLQGQIQELRRTYQGILFILRHVITQSEYTENHCFRVSIYAVKIAAALGLEEAQVENIRSAALLHDLGSHPINMDILKKASSLMNYHQDKTIASTSTKSEQDELGKLKKSPLKTILPLLLGHSESDAKQKNDRNDQAPGTVILALADRYDELTTGKFRDDPTPDWSARNQIIKHEADQFTPEVLQAFSTAFKNGQMHIPDIVI